MKRDTEYIIKTLLNMKDWRAIAVYLCLYYAQERIGQREISAICKIGFRRIRKIFKKFIKYDMVKTGPHNEVLPIFMSRSPVIELRGEVYDNLFGEYPAHIISTFFYLDHSTGSSRTSYLSVDKLANELSICPKYLRTALKILTDLDLIERGRNRITVIH